MTSFADAASWAGREAIGPQLARDESRAYLKTPERRAEAESVDPCVQWLADYELDAPAHGKGVGRYSPVTMTPPLAHLLKGKRDKLDNQEVMQLREGIARAVGCGYVPIASLEPDVESWDAETEPDAMQIWNLWVVRLNASETLEAIGLRDDVIKPTRDTPQAVFTARLIDLGLMPKLRKRMRYQLVGMWYGQAGMVLRLLQNGGLASDLDETSDVWQLTNTWPFER